MSFPTTTCRGCALKMTIQSRSAAGSVPIKHHYSAFSHQIFNHVAPRFQQFSTHSNHCWAPSQAKISTEDSLDSNHFSTAVPSSQQNTNNTRQFHDIIKAASDLSASGISPPYYHRKYKMLKLAIRKWIRQHGRIPNSQERTQLQNLTRIKRKTLHAIIATVKEEPGIISPQSKAAFLHYMDELQQQQQQSDAVSQSTDISPKSTNSAQQSIQRPNPKQRRLLCRLTGWNRRQLSQQIAYYTKARHPLTEENKMFIKQWFEANNRQRPSKSERRELSKRTGLSTYQISYCLDHLENPPGEILPDTKERLKEWLDEHGIPNGASERRALQKLTGLNSRQLHIQLELITDPKGRVNAQNKQIVRDFIETHCKPKGERPSTLERDSLQQKIGCSRKQLNYMIDVYYRSNGSNGTEHGSERKPPSRQSLTKSRKLHALSENCKGILQEWMKQHPSRMPTRAERVKLSHEVQCTAEQVYQFFYRNLQPSRSVTHAHRELIRRFLSENDGRVPDRYERKQIQEETGLSRAQIASLVFYWKKRY